MEQPRVSSQSQAWASGCRGPLGHTPRPHGGWPPPRARTTFTTTLSIAGQAEWGRWALAAQGSPPRPRLFLVARSALSGTRWEKLHTPRLLEFQASGLSLPREGLRGS